MARRVREPGGFGARPGGHAAGACLAGLVHALLQQVASQDATLTLSGCFKVIGSMLLQGARLRGERPIAQARDARDGG